MPWTIRACPTRSRLSIVRAGSFAPPPRVEMRQSTEDAVRKQHDDRHQEHADPEVPVLRRNAGELVARDHEDDGADQPAIETAGAAEHQHYQHIGRALEADR